MTKQPPFTITIHVGKGVTINAPFKKTWTVAEWRRMTEHMDNALKGVPNIEDFR